MPLAMVDVPLISSDAKKSGASLSLPSDGQNPLILPNHVPIITLEQPWSIPLTRGLTEKGKGSQDTTLVRLGDGKGGNLWKKGGLTWFKQPVHFIVWAGVLMILIDAASQWIAQSPTKSKSKCNVIKPNKTWNQRGTRTRAAMNRHLPPSNGINVPTHPTSAPKVDSDALEEAPGPAPSISAGCSYIPGLVIVSFLFEV